MNKVTLQPRIQQSYVTAPAWFIPELCCIDTGNIDDRRVDNAAVLMWKDSRNRALGLSDGRGGGMMCSLLPKHNLAFSVVARYDCMDSGLQLKE